MPLPPRIPGATGTYPNLYESGDVPKLPIQDKLEELRVTNFDESTPGFAQTNRTYTPPTGSKTETLQLADRATPAPQLNEQIGFTARTVIISNWTPQFAWVETIGDYVAPWVVNMVKQVPSGTQNAKIQFAPPPGVTQPAAVSTTSLIITLTEDFLMPTNGLELKLPTLPT